MGGARPAQTGRRRPGGRLAFRAGNYGIQPGAERVFAALAETGYRVDSSVVPGLVLRNDVDILELGADPGRLRRITERYLRRAGTDVDFSFSCHPKEGGEPELEALLAYDEWLRGAYDIDAVSFRAVAETV